MSDERGLPYTETLGEELEIGFRVLARGDAERLLDFTRSLEEQDLLFLRTDVTDPLVVADWIRSVEDGRTRTVVATRDDEVVGYGSLHLSEILWTRHLGEMRILVASDLRGRGVGAHLARQVFVFARRAGLQKIVAQMMASQREAQSLLHHLGFIPEAMLRDWVIDRKGATHDLIVMSREVEDGLGSSGAERRH